MSGGAEADKCLIVVKKGRERAKREGCQGLKAERSKKKTEDRGGDQHLLLGQVCPTGTHIPNRFQPQRLRFRFQWRTEGIRLWLLQEAVSLVWSELRPRYEANSTSAPDVFSKLGSALSIILPFWNPKARHELRAELKGLHVNLFVGQNSHL